MQELETTEQFLAVLDGFPTKFPAGERFSYCNGGFVVLALLAERASGIDFHDLVDDRVLRPAGMVDSGFLRSDDLPGRAALGYVDGRPVATNVFHLPVRGNGDGGMYTTTADMHRFWAALFAGAIVSPGDGRPDDEPAQRRARGGPAVRAGVLAARRRATSRRSTGYDAGVSFRSFHDPAEQLTVTVVGTTSRGRLADRAAARGPAGHHQPCRLAHHRSPADIASMMPSAQASGIGVVCGFTIMFMPSTDARAVIGRVTTAITASRSAAMVIFVSVRVR